MSTISPAMPERTYWRCRHCLLPFVLLNPQAIPSGGTCGCCGSQSFDYMGKVQVIKQKPGNLAQGCRCNESCAKAQGPRCTCACGGLHHGTGMDARFQHDTASCTRILIPAAPKTQLRAKDRAIEWRAALQAAQKGVDSWMAGQSGLATDDRDFYKQLQLENMLNLAQKARQHEPRMQILQDLQQLLNQESTK